MPRPSVASFRACVVAPTRQVGRPERRLVPRQQIETRRDGAPRTRPIEVGPPQHRRRQPRARPPVGPAAIPGSGGELSCARANAVSPSSTASSADDTRTEADSDVQPRPLETFGDRVGLLQQIRRAGRRRRTWSARTATYSAIAAHPSRSLAGTGEGDLASRWAASTSPWARHARASRRRASARSLTSPPSLRALTAISAFARASSYQPGRQHQLAPVRREHTGAPTRIADPLVQRHRRAANDASAVTMSPCKPGGERMVVGSPAGKEVLLVGPSPAVRRSPNRRALRRSDPDTPERRPGCTAVVPRAPGPARARWWPTRRCTRRPLRRADPCPRGRAPASCPDRLARSAAASRVHRLGRARAPRPVCLGHRARAPARCSTCAASTVVVDVDGERDRVAHVLARRRRGDSVHVPRRPSPSSPTIRAAADASSRSTIGRAAASASDGDRDGRRALAVRSTTLRRAPRRSRATILPVSGAGLKCSWICVIDRRGDTMKNSVDRPKPPFIDPDGRPRLRARVVAVRADRTPARRGHRRSGTASAATSRRSNDVLDAAEQVRRHRLRGRRADRRAGDPVGIPACPIRPDSVDVVGLLRAVNADRDEPVLSRTPCSGSARSPPIPCTSAPSGPTRCISARRTGRPDAFRRTRAPPDRPSLLGSGLPRPGQGAGRATVAILDTGVRGRRSARTVRGRLHRHRHARAGVRPTSTPTRTSTSPQGT